MKAGPVPEPTDDLTALKPKPNKEMSKVVMVTNMLAPYRIGFYNCLSRVVDYSVILDTMSEFNRSWNLAREALEFEVIVQDCRSFVYRRLRRDVGYSEKRQFQFSEKTYLKLREASPEVVVTIEFGFKTLWSLAYGWIHGVPVILASEGTMHTEGHVGRLKGWLRKLLVSQCSRFWTNGPASTALLVSYGADPSLVDEGMTGIDTAEWVASVQRHRARRDEIRRKHGLEGRVFLFSGSLSSRKGVIQMARAVEAASKERDCPPFSLLILGEGEDRAWLEDWKSRNPGIRAVLMGFVQHEDLPEFFAAADWAVLPTLDDNWPLATLETLVAGLPQMFSIYNGATVDLCHPDTGLSFDPLDEEDFRRSFSLALRSPLECVPRERMDSISHFYSAQSQAERAVASIEAVIRS